VDNFHYTFVYGVNAGRHVGRTVIGWTDDARFADVRASGSDFENAVPVVHYASTRVKKTVTGHGRAAKDQMQRTIQRELGLAELPSPPDVADALAVALCHYYQQHWPIAPKKTP